MSWIRSSEGVALGVLLVVLLGAVGTVAAISVSGSPPSASLVGEDVEMTASVEDPFDGPPDQYVLRGTTELDNASWTVSTVNQGDPVETVTSGGQSFEMELNVENSATDVEIELQGTVPDLTSFNYQDSAAEEYEAMTLVRVSNGTETELDSWSVHRFTESTQAAREAIDAAIEAGARDATDDSEQAVTNAIEFYNGGNFEQAITNAENAEELAEEAADSGGPPMLLIGGALVLLLIVIAAVAYVYQSNKSSGHKLQ
jgi:hypothetical protein